MYAGDGYDLCVGEWCWRCLAGDAGLEVMDDVVLKDVDSRAQV